MKKGGIFSYFKPLQDTPSKELPRGPKEEGHVIPPAPSSNRQQAATGGVPPLKRPRENLEKAPSDDEDSDCDIGMKKVTIAPLNALQKSIQVVVCISRCTYTYNITFPSSPPPPPQPTPPGAAVRSS